MFERIPEKEIMDNHEQVIAYANGDFTDSINYYTESFLKKFPQVKEILDIGCGPADVATLIALQKKEAHVTALDASSEMLDFSKQVILNKHKEIKDRISFINKRLQEAKFNHSFDSIISKDFLHHLENPMDLWNFIKNNAKNGTVLYHMDLIRVNSPEEAKNIVETVTKDADQILKEDFYNSLLAAFTIDEVKEQLAKVGLDYLDVHETDTKRHFVIEGIFRT